MLVAITHGMWPLTKKLHATSPTFLEMLSRYQGIHISLHDKNAWFLNVEPPKYVGAGGVALSLMELISSACAQNAQQQLSFLPTFSRLSSTRWNVETKTATANFVGGFANKSFSSLPFLIVPECLSEMTTWAKILKRMYIWKNSTPLENALGRAANGALSLFQLAKRTI